MIVTEDARGDKGITYLEIGHKNNEHNYVWKYKDGKLYVEQASRHMDAERKKGSRMPMTFDFAGQFEADNGALSLMPSYSKERRPVPNSVIRALEREFGEDARIFIFSD